MTKSDARIISAEELSAPLPSWRLHLEAASISARSIQAYTDDGAFLVAYLARQGMPARACPQGAQHPSEARSRHGATSAIGSTPVIGRHAVSFAETATEMRGVGEAPCPCYGPDRC